ncbi:hypothetical protein PIB30_085471, partial [Stylosanthes scabra]|nr:hypothetical protein [Stylosanthes scabra]
MTTCPPAEISSIVDTFRMTRAQHSDPGASGPWCPTYSSPPMMGTPAFDPRTIGLWATPPSYDAPSSYHSHSYGSHSAPPPTMDEAHQTTERDQTSHLWYR